MRTYRVKEIFGPTLQGEGPHSGLTVLFVRMAGCNRWNGRPESKPRSICNYCDTDFVGGKQMTAGDILSELVELHGRRSFRPQVVISGGEPMLQVDENLLETLYGFADLHMETNGSLPLPENLHAYFRCITVSPKQPASETALTRPHALKFLYPWIGPGINPEAFETENSAVFIQPIENLEYEKNLTGAIGVCLGNPSYRLSLQMHKILSLR